MEWKEMIGKEVFCKTKTSGVCSGTIKDFIEQDRILVILDQYNEKWFINVNEILRLKEEKLDSHSTNSKKGLIKRSY